MALFGKRLGKFVPQCEGVGGCVGVWGSSEALRQCDEVRYSEACGLGPASVLAAAIC